MHGWYRFIFHCHLIAKNDGCSHKFGHAWFSWAGYESSQKVSRRNSTSISWLKWQQDHFSYQTLGEWMDQAWTANNKAIKDTFTQIPQTKIRNRFICIIRWSLVSENESWCCCFGLWSICTLYAYRMAGTKSSCCAFQCVDLSGDLSRFQSNDTEPDPAFPEQGSCSWGGRDLRPKVTNPWWWDKAHRGSISFVR